MARDRSECVSALGEQQTPVGVEAADSVSVQSGDLRARLDQLGADLFAIAEQLRSLERQVDGNALRDMHRRRRLSAGE
jgi:hypothetical protein